MTGLKQRYQDTIHSIFRMVQSRRDKIAKRAEKLISQGASSMSLDFPDPLEPFRNAVTLLLAPKELDTFELPSQNLLFKHNNQKLTINNLSSGEREVVNIVFDFLLRNPTNSIVFFDEPELHLHPELSYKLLQTLKAIGNNNQFIFCTHSPDIINASLDDSVIFISPPKKNTNQAVLVREEDDTNQALKLIGHSIGVISLGRKLVLIEGNYASLDKQVYGAILKNKFPNLVLVPSEGKGVITSFSTIIDRVLERTIWGIDFYMLCDRDAVPVMKDKSILENKSNNKLKVLSRYHLENYFLDEEILALVFEEMDTEDSTFRSPEKIREILLEIAHSMISYTVSLIISAEYREKIGNLDIMPKNCHQLSQEQLISKIIQKSTEEKERILNTLEEINLKTTVNKTTEIIKNSLTSSNNMWKEYFPGKQILKRFAHRTKLDVDRIKQLYIKRAITRSNNPFQEIEDIFKNFSQS